jgi:hypothetical protein
VTTRGNGGGHGEDGVDVVAGACVLDRVVALSHHDDESADGAQASPVLSPLSQRENMMTKSERCLWSFSATDARLLLRIRVGNKTRLE